MSYKERAWFDNHRASDNGYRPNDRAADYTVHAMHQPPDNPPATVGTL